MSEKKKVKKEDVSALDVVDFSNMPDMQQFAVLNKLVMRDLNRYYEHERFYKFKKIDIAKFLMDPARNEKRIRDAVSYVYNASPHFRRLIHYFAGLTDWAYIVSPSRTNPHSANPRTTGVSYRKVLNLLSNMNIRNEFPKILITVLRDDVFYGTIWETSDNITIQQLPTNWCKITTIEGNVPNVTFKFSYFNTRLELLQYYPEEFSIKYERYKADPLNMLWQELDSPTSFAVKCNTDIMGYALPPFAGVLRAIYELEDYQQLKLDRTALENYALLVMKIGLDEDGDYDIDYNKAKDFFGNLSSVIPEEVGAVLSPLPIEKISFERTNAADTDTVTDAEQAIFNASGVSSLLFANTSPSANALKLSIMADQMITFGIVRNIEAAVNRFIQSKPYGKYFKMTFLDVSPYNRDDMGNMYLKGCQYGFPMISQYAATLGLSQSELDSMSFLENDVLGLPDMFKPLQSSSTMSSSEESKGATDEGGAPTKSDDELTEKGEESRERE